MSYILNTFKNNKPTVQANANILIEVMQINYFKFL